MNIRSLLNELKKCNFKCEGGSLENHSAFRALEEKVDDEHSRCCLGRHHPCDLNVNDGFCAADNCQYKVKSL